MAMNSYDPEVDVAEIREEVLKVYTSAAAEKVTEPAAFGVACEILKKTLRCNLTTASLLLDCWLTEAKLSKVEKK